ncbi:LLM class flavin-dependent oxidoreductase [Allostreptomyces psammosilenae]|uniref:Alkanesulfonate monooxygenase SsuD/methylene tetrahydromethanopterin reductase-like flavin-dependent oxidoreductase (Luciferase family) n=1 Tax=Allostreptomyces psammosilenae TaxID=1892865 RepID=A0A852ZS85_9ACTN|nr:LLM class flavin-dependent oxidoreductase [Allostreptomyces psammosilenae]NYI04337.1 alkanesulfonate monooxygenase SsuD/methylene tetrahydromethanopterin reductase-like flavin-dependent oxidoreductase (luciferase family) [Allostreptomyces psammosilenae]
MSRPSTPAPSRPFRLAVEIDGAGRHPAAWRLPDAEAEALHTADRHVRLARLADRAGFDLLFWPDSFAAPATRPDEVRGTLDAVAIAARVAPLTTGIGLVPTATTTHTEPFHLSKAIATLDLVSEGRAGWQVDVSTTEAEARHFGRKPAAPAEVLWREADDAVEVVGRLWDSWEDDAVIRDVATGRYVDRDKLHYVDFAGEFFSVRGPSITPRSPQGQPVVVVRATDGPSLAVAAARADVVRVRAAGADEARRTRERVRAAVAAAGRDPEQVTVLLDVEVLVATGRDEARLLLERLDALAGTVHAPRSLLFTGTPARLADLLESLHRDGAADGVTLVPLALPGTLRTLAECAAEELRLRGLLDEPAPGGTLRERLGLPRPASRYALPA